VSEIIDFYWLDSEHFAFVTSAGVEMYQVFFIGGGGLVEGEQESEGESRRARVRGPSHQRE